MANITDPAAPEQPDTPVTATVRVTSAPAPEQGSSADLLLRLVNKGLPGTVALTARRYDVPLQPEHVKLVSDAAQPEPEGVFCSIEVIIDCAESRVDQEPDIRGRLWREVDDLTDVVAHWLSPEKDIPLIDVSVKLQAPDNPASGTTA